MTKQILLLAVCVLFSGCVVLTKDDQLKNVSEINSRQCEQIGIEAVFRNASDKKDEEASVYDPNQEGWEGSDNRWKIKNRLEETKILIYPPNKTNPQKYKVVFTEKYGMFESRLQRVAFFTTIFTLGIIPSYGTGKYQFEVDVYDKSDKKLASYKTSEVPFSMLSGIIFYPVALGMQTFNYDKDSNPVAILTDEVLLMMIQDKLISCRTKQQ